MWTPQHRNLKAQLDLVALWKHIALARACVAERERQHATKPFLHVQATLGFAALSAFTQLYAICEGVAPALPTIFLLPSMVLVQELPRALFARAWGRSSRILMSAAASDTQLVGKPLLGSARLLFDSAGSIANVAVSLLLLHFSGRVAGSPLALLRMFAAAHGAWGFAQVLPLVPFRAGLSLGQRLRPALRFAHTSLSVVLLSMVMAGLSHSPAAFAFFPVLTLASLGAWRG